MHKFISFTSGAYTYEIPIAEVAGMRHREILAANPELSEKDIIATVVAEFEHPDGIVAFLRRQPWSSLAGSVRMIRWSDTVPDMNAATFDAPYNELHTALQPNETSLSRVPVDLFMSIMWQEDIPLLATIINHGGVPKAAILFIHGDKEAIDAHMHIALQLSQQMHERPEGAPKPPRPQYNH